MRKCNSYAGKVNIIGHPLLVQLRLHFLLSLTVVDKKSEFDNSKIDLNHIQSWAPAT